MKFAHFRIYTTFVISLLILGVATYADAQKAPAIPNQALPEIRTNSPLPSAPAEIFSACTGIMDRKKREDCIEQQTSKRNPATKTKPGDARQDADKPTP